jgi:hypothetical protein
MIGNDRIRVCLFCARSYLDLHKPRNERATSRGCLVCPAAVDPRGPDAATAYKKDFLLMSMDDGVYPCFHDDEGCAFEGTRQALDRHIRDGCDYRFTACPEASCRRNLRAKDLDEHRRVACPAYKACSECHENIRKDDEDKHMRDAHEERCPDRLVRCRLCDNIMPWKRFRQHLSDHVKGYERVIEEKEYRATMLDEEIRRFRGLLEQTMEMIHGYDLSSWRQKKNC